MRSGQQCRLFRKPQLTGSLWALLSKVNYVQVHYHDVQKLASAGFETVC